MTETLRKVAFVCLPDHELEVFSAVTRHAAYRPEVVVDLNSQSYCFKLAEILQIPTSDDLAALKSFPCPIVVIPDERPDLKVEVTDLLGDPTVLVLPVSEMANRLGLPKDNEATPEAEYSPAEWSVPIEIQPEESVATAGHNGAGHGAGPVSTAPRDREPAALHEDGPAFGGGGGAGPLRARGASGFPLMDETTVLFNDTPEPPGKAAPVEPAPATRLTGSASAATPAARGAAAEASTRPPVAADGPATGAPDAPARPAAESAARPSAPADAGSSELGLSAVVETLNLAFDKHLLLKRILEIAVNSAGGDSGSIMLLDESGEYLRIAVSNGLSDEIVRRTRQRVGEGVAGSILLEGRPRVLVDKLNDPRYRSGRERSAIKSAVCVPIKCGSRPIGVLNVSSDQRADAFDERSMQLLEKLGLEVAGVILRALKLSPGDGQSLESTLKTHIDGILSMDLPLRGRLEAAAEKFAQLIAAAACRIYLYDGTGKRLELFGEYGQGSLRAGAGTVLADQGILGWVASRGKPEALISAHSDGDKRALFYFPLVARDRLGIIELESVPVDESSRVEVFEAMEKAARHLTAKIEQERSTKLLARRTEQVLRLSDVAAELMADRNADELTELAVHAAAELFGADLATLRQVKDGTLTLSNPEFGLQGSAASIGLLDFEADLGACAAARNQVFTQVTMPPDFQERLAELGDIRWAVAVPLTVPGGGPLAVLSVFGLSDASPAPQGEELTLLEKLGGYVARSLSRNGSAAAPRSQPDGFMHWTVFQERINEEIKRANRYGRSFAVTTLELENLRDHAAGRSPAWLDEARGVFAQFVRSQIREVDIPAWVREGRAAVLSPEATESVSGLGRRLETAWAEFAAVSQVTDLPALALRVEEVLFPRDTRNWDEFVDLVADRFGEGYKENDGGL